MAAMLGQVVRRLELSDLFTGRREELWLGSVRLCSQLE
jgi:hypothetical protein